MAFSFFSHLLLDIDADVAVAAHESFLTRRNYKARVIEYDPPHLEKCYPILGPLGRWTMVRYEPPGPDKIQKEINMDICQRKARKMFYIYSPDGSFWAYEFYSRGEILDRFCSDPIAAASQGLDVMKTDAWKGNPDVIGQHLDWYPKSRVRAYLTQKPNKKNFPTREAYQQEIKRLDVKTHPNDRFTLFSEMALLNFLSFLGVSVPIDANTNVQKAIVLE